jgi:hypothetical protein
MGFVETDDILPNSTADEATEFCKFGFPYLCPLSVLNRCEGVRCDLKGVFIRRFKGGNPEERKISPKGDIDHRKIVRKINFK